MTLERYVAAVAAVLLAAAAVITIRRAWRRLASPIEPLGVFFLVWSLTLGLFALPWIRFSESSLTAWLVIYGAIVAFTIGALAAYRLPLRFRHSERPVEAVDPRRLQIALTVCVLAAWIGFAAFLHAVNGVVGWSKVFTDPQLVRAIQTTSSGFQSAYGPWKLLTYFGGVGFLLWTLGLRLGAFRGRARWLAVVGALSAVPYLFTTDRALFVTTIVWTGLFHLVWRPIVRLRRAALILLTISVLTLAGFMVIGSRRGTTIGDFPAVEQRLTTQSFRSLALPYLYLTSDVPIFTQLMTDPNRPHTHGALTFLPAVKIANRLGLAGTPPTQFSAFYPVPFSAENVASWLAPFYLDYGIAGCLILPFLLGLGVVMVARYAFAHRTILAAWLLATVLLATAATPIADKFSDTITWELAAAGVILAPLLTGASPRDGLARLRQWRWPATPLARTLALGGVTLFIVPIAVAVVETRARPAATGNLAALRRVLVNTNVRAQRAYRRFGYQDPLALASQLRLSEPNVNFAALTSQVPLAPGTVGVLSSPAATTLRVDSSNGQILEMSSESTGRVLGPDLATGEGLLVEGGFQIPDDAWAPILGTVARLTLEKKVGPARTRALVVTGTGRLGSPTAVSQEVLDLPDKDAGAIYRLRVSYRTRRLSRPVAVELQLIYSNGSSQAFLGHPSDLHDSPGVPAGTVRRWHLLQVNAVARAPLTAVVAFPVDTGVTRLRGRLWLARVSLESAGSAR